MGFKINHGISKDDADYDCANNRTLSEQHAPAYITVNEGDGEEEFIVSKCGEDVILHVDLYEQVGQTRDVAVDSRIGGSFGFGQCNNCCTELLNPF